MTIIRKSAAICWKLHDKVACGFYWQWQTQTVLPYRGNREKNGFVNYVMNELERV